MVIQTKLKHQHLKSVWLVICEAGDAVCGVVKSSSAATLRDLIYFILF